MNKQLQELFTTEQRDAFIKRMSDVAIADIVAKTKSASEADTGRFKVIISTDSMDRGGDVVIQEALNFDNYMKNPVVLWGHDYFSLPIGVTDSIKNEGKQTVCEGRFAPTPEAQKVRAYYDGGFPLGASIGYILNDREGEKITAAEMLEFSFCAIPMNQDCVPLREARLKNLDIAFLATKGIKFADILESKINKKAESGDSCQTDEGDAGTFADDGNGNLVCESNEEKKIKTETNPSKDELDVQLRTDLATEYEGHATTTKAILEKCFKAIEESKSATNPAEECHKAMDSEHTRHKAAHTACIEEYMQKMTATSANDDPTKALEQKAGAELSKKNKEKIQAAHDAATTAIEHVTKSVSALKEILEGTKSSEEPEVKKPDEPKVEPKGIDLSGVDNVQSLRSVLKGLATSVGETLEVINNKGKANR